MKNIVYIYNTLNIFITKLSLQINNHSNAQTNVFFDEIKM